MMDDFAMRLFKSLILNEILQKGIDETSAEARFQNSLLEKLIKAASSQTAVYF
jgi:hypothetical protein